MGGFSAVHMTLTPTLPIHKPRSPQLTHNQWGQLELTQLVHLNLTRNRHSAHNPPQRHHSTSTFLRSSHRVTVPY